MPRPDRGIVPRVAERGTPRCGTRGIVLVAVAAVVAVVAAACGRGTVQIAFHPKDGARYSYQVTVRASTVTKVGDAAPEMQSQEQVLRAEQTVLSVDSLGSRVQVRLTGDDGTPREFVVRFDRAAQLAEVQRIEGLPANVLGDLGLTEIFPAAAGAPPDRPLQPGDRWTVDEPVTLPGVAASHLKGNGRLLALGIVNGRKVATTETTFSLPVERTVDAASARILLTGTQHTTTTATRALVDGSVQEAHAVTSGTFDMTLLPPDGSAPALHGTLELHVDSTTRRLG